MPCGFKSRPRYHDMSRYFRRLFRKITRMLSTHEPLITVSISRERLLHNLHTYQSAYPDLKVAPMLKSNAYGHGLCLVAELLDREDIAFFAVDSYFEARRLREGGIRTKILVMGYVRPEYIARNGLYDTEYAITDLEQLREVSRAAERPVRLHMKLDTGMHRNGILETDLVEAIELVRANPNLIVSGICSHLADADNHDASFSQSQLGVWERCVAQLKTAFPSLQYRHISATKGARFSKNASMNTVRVGMGLFGCDTSPHADLPLSPVLSMRSFITSIREISTGESVGYNGTFVAQRASRIATVPVGYHEGIDRGLSNRGMYSVRSTLCPIAGRVSMNMSSIDVTDIPDASRGDEIVVISNTSKDPHSIQSMARTIDTSPYVLLAHIPEHLARIVE